MARIWPNLPAIGPERADPCPGHGQNGLKPPISGQICPGLLPFRHGSSPSIFATAVGGVNLMHAPAWRPHIHITSAPHPCAHKPIPSACNSASAACGLTGHSGSDVLVTCRSSARRRRTASSPSCQPELATQLIHSTATTRRAGYGSRPPSMSGVRRAPCAARQRERRGDLEKFTAHHHRRR